jgi:hypothetical protein
MTESFPEQANKWSPKVNTTPTNNNTSKLFGVQRAEAMQQQQQPDNKNHSSSSPLWPTSTIELLPGF